MTFPHNHQEGNCFVVRRGSEAGNQQTPVCPKDEPAWITRLAVCADLYLPVKGETHCQWLSTKVQHQERRKKANCLTLLLAKSNCIYYVWWLAGRLVTLHTLYFLFICPQWVISTFKPNGLKTKAVTHLTNISEFQCSCSAPEHHPYSEVNTF